MLPFAPCSRDPDLTRPHSSLPTCSSSCHGPPLHTRTHAPTPIYARHTHDLTHHLTPLISLINAFFSFSPRSQLPALQVLKDTYEHEHPESVTAAATSGLSPETSVRDDRPASAALCNVEEVYLAWNSV